jgi:hypothetical protein
MFSIDAAQPEPAAVQPEISNRRWTILRRRHGD